MRPLTHKQAIPVTDEQLMASVRDGDVGRLGELFERNGRMFFGYFVRLTNDPELGNDLLQEMFLRILKYRHTYRDVGSFKAWAFRIARNLVRDHYGRSGREVSLDLVADAPSPTVLPLAQVENAEMVRVLHESFAELPVDKRELLVLSHFEHIPYAQIADMMSCSVGAVKVRVHRAVKDLREIFMQRIERGKNHES